MDRGETTNKLKDANHTNKSQQVNGKKKTLQTSPNQRQRPRDSVLTVRQCCCIFVSLGLVGVNGLHLEVKMLEGGRLLDINRCSISYYRTSTSQRSINLPALMMHKNTPSHLDDQVEHWKLEGCVVVNGNALCYLDFCGTNRALEDGKYSLFKSRKSPKEKHLITLCLQRSKCQIILSPCCSAWKYFSLRR